MRPYGFVHVPKVAGVAITRALGSRGLCHVPPTDTHPMHVTARRVVEQVGERAWREAFTFGFVRNPWDRLVSLYHYQRRQANRPEHRVGFDDWLAAHGPDWNGRRPQLFWLCDEDGRELVDFVGRYERLSTDFAYVARQLGRPDLKLSRMNTSTREPYQAYYSDWQRDMVGEWYADEVARYGYQF